MRICITGVAGFIGSSLADRLIAERHEVWGIDNFATGRRENLDPGLTSFPGLVHGGVEEDFAFSPSYESDLIIHCAAAYKNPMEWETDVSTNVLGAQMVAERAMDQDARIFYFQTVLPPISSYAISKIAGEHYLRLSGQPLTVFRLASVYGPRNLSGAVPTFYRQIKAGEPCTVVEDATRDFVFIEDLVERVREYIYLKPDATHFPSAGTFDIRTGIEMRIADIPGMIGEILGVEPQIKLIPRPPHDVPHYDMDGVPRVGTSFKAGLEKTIAWYEENGVGETYSHLGALNT